jgi:hypothetical protein
MVACFGGVHVKMNQAYYLGRMQQELKARIESDSVYASWVKQGLTLEQIGCDPAIMQSIYSQLTMRERQVLFAVVAFIGCEPFDWARLQSYTASSMSAAETKVGFLLLVNKGILYTFRKSWGEFVYVMAHDSLLLWQQILWADGQIVVSIANQAEDISRYIELTEQGGPGIADAILQSLVYLSQNELKLGKNGTLHKRQLHNWAQLLPIRDEWLSAAGIAYAYDDIYPASIAIVLDFMIRLQIVEMGKERILIHNEAAKQWLLLSVAEQNKRIYELWKQVVFPAECWLQHAILLLERQLGEDWISLEAVIQWLRKCGIIRAGSIAVDSAMMNQLEDRWLLPLLAFGWLEKGICHAASKGDTGWYRWRKHPLAAVAGSQPLAAVAGSQPLETAGRFYVQPDFEVLVPPDTPIAIRWELSAIADHCHTDQMSQYKISKKSLARGIGSGRAIDHIINFLERHALYGIPDNMRLTLEQWAKPLGKVRMEQALLLRCEDVTVAASINKLPGISECLLEPIGDQTWLVRAEMLPVLTALLDNAGWMTGKIVARDGSNSTQIDEGQALMLDTAELTRYERVEQKIAAVGFIYSRQPVVHFEMGQQLHVIEDVYPNLDHVPVAWMKEYRTYHPTTRKEIIEAAIAWGTAIQIRVAGLDRKIVPSRIQETRGTWSLTGFEDPLYQEVCLLHDEWQEMKIMLPGLYEKY